MDSNSITDEQGKHLRGRYFPFHLNRKLPPVTANAVHRPELVLSMKSHRASTVPHTIKKKVPTTHMILDYRQDKKHLVDQAAKELEREAAMISPISAPPPLALSPQMSMRSLDMQNNSPKNTMRKLRFEAQPLRSSFVLRKKKGLDGSIDLSDFLFNKAEAGTQTEYKVERLDLPTLGEYQAWNNTVAEPFFKVRLLNRVNFA